MPRRNSNAGTRITDGDRCFDANWRASEAARRTKRKRKKKGRRPK